MKTLIRNLFFFISVILIISACQSAGDINSPTSELDKKGGNNSVLSITPINTVPGEETCVELVAGQHNVVGSVCIRTEGSNLKIKYNITNSDWSITETHLAVVGNPNNFPRTSNGNPKVGHFPYKGTHNNVSEVEYTVPIGNLPSTVYVAAHAVVKNCNVTPTPNLCPDLSEYPQYVVGQPTQQNGNWYYFRNRINLLRSDNSSVAFSGWCADQDRSVPYPMDATNVKFLCSAVDDPQFSCFIESTDYRTNLNKLNHLINEFPLGTEVFDASNNSLGFALMQEIQTVIWKLVDEDPIQPNNGLWNPNLAIVNRILELLDPNFSPVCGQKVAVFVLKDVDYCSTPGWQTVQPLIIELPVECVPGECESETAWGFPYNNGPVPGQSALFGSQWARYFSYLK